MAFTTGDDLNILQSSDSVNIGAGVGNDTYIINASSMGGTQTATITDTEGTNTIKIVGGVTIASSIVAANVIQLTLSSGAVINLLGADNFTYEIGGDFFATGTGTLQTFSNFVTQSLGIAAIPTESNTTTGNNVQINSDGTVTGEDETTVTTGSEFSIAATSVTEGNSGTTDLVVSITRTGDISAAASVDVSTSGGSATGNEDYTDITIQTIDFAIDASTATFVVSVIADTSIELDETLTASLSSPSTNSSISTTAGSAILTIINDDATATFTLSRNTWDNDLDLLGVNNNDLLFI